MEEKIACSGHSDKSHNIFPCIFYLHRGGEGRRGRGLVIPYPYNSDDVTNYFLLTSLFYDKLLLSTDLMGPCFKNVHFPFSFL